MAAFRQIVRHLARRPTYSLINLLGLSVSLGVCLVIGVYLHNELSYNDAYPGADRIHVMGINDDLYGATASTDLTIGPLVERYAPEADTVARAEPPTTVPTAAGASENTLPLKWANVEPVFADLFSLEPLAGEPAAALERPDAAVLTRSGVRRVFGQGTAPADAVGRTVRLGEDPPATRTVRAVVADPPERSTMRYQALRPLDASTYSDGRIAIGYKTYVRLDEPTSGEAFTERVRSVAEDHHQRASLPYVSVPLPDLYLSPLHEAGGFRGKARYLYIFGSGALLLLLIAIINYVNLATAQGLRRAREIAVRKTMGAGQARLARLLLGESVGLGVGASLLGLGLAAGLLPVFGSTVGVDLVAADLLGLPIVAALGAGAAVGLLAGCYPAFVIASTDPARVFQKGRGTVGSGDGWVRRSLVVVQFAVSMVLVAGTFVIDDQLAYVQTKDLGFDDEKAALSGPLGDRALENPSALRKRLESRASVRSATVANSAPGKGAPEMGLPPQVLSGAHDVGTDSTSVSIEMVATAGRYVETLGLTLVAGRDFEPGRPTDRRGAVLINETLAQDMGWEPDEAVGKPIRVPHSDAGDGGWRRGEVIGVLEDFHTQSLRKPIGPVLVQQYPVSSGGARFPPRAVVRLASGQVAAGLDHVRSVLSGVTADGTAPSIEFLDETFGAMYRTERRLRRLFLGFAAVAIAVACLGLYGLLAYTVQRRTREIGIRKALGATRRQVVGLLTREYAALVAVAFVLAAPAAYVLMQRWLQGFAYHIDLGAAPFVMTLGVALLVAALGVAGKALRAARLDPTRALREE